MADTLNILNQLKKIGSSVSILTDAPLKDYSTFRIGGPAKLLLIPKNIASLKEVLSITRPFRKYIIGNGSKILFPDRGINGIIIRVSGGMDDICVNGRNVIVGAGMRIQNLLSILCSHGLSGLEFAAGVPAALGGASVMNLGAKGSQMSDIIEWVEVMDHSGNSLKLDKNDLDFGYRKSGIKNVIVTSMKLRLFHDKTVKIERRIKENLRWRINSQPYGTANAGSVFKNPVNMPAGKLIELSGMKGEQAGDAQVSHIHANFIVNKGHAKAADVTKLIAEIKAKVFDRYGKKLELELIDSGRLNMIF